MNPQTITFLAPAGGAGRTTTVMALASALVEEKSFPPLVIDATPEARLRPARDTTLGRWHRRMLETGVTRDQLRVQQVADADELIAVLDAHVRQRFPDFGSILIDTGGRLDEVALTAAANSDLIVAPFMDALTAQRISEALDGINLGDTPLYGLRCGDTCDDAIHRAVSAAFTAGRLFVHGLPSSPQLADISVGGHLFTTYTRLICEYAHLGLGDPDRASVNDFIRVRSEIGQLLDEIRLALDGYELRQRTLRPRRNPLPLHKLAPLLPT